MRMKFSIALCTNEMMKQVNSKYWLDNLIRNTGWIFDVLVISKKNLLHMNKNPAHIYINELYSIYIFVLW